MGGRAVLVCALLLSARARGDARSRVRAHSRQSDPRAAARETPAGEEMDRSTPEAALHTLYGQWAGQRAVKQTSHPSPAFGVSFRKCAQVDAGQGSAQLRVTLMVSNPEGRDLSQLCIRDSVSDVTLLQTNGSRTERGYQSFSADSLTAGSQFVVSYRMSVNGNRKQVLSLPAFLTFSNATQNDIHLFGPMEANFTLDINPSEQVAADVPLLLLVFLLSFLLTLLSLGAVALILHRRRTPPARSVVSEEAGPYEGMSDIAASANEEAAFEDKFVDIVMLEDPQNMSQALDSLSVVCVSRVSLSVECVRVRLFWALLSVLLAGSGVAGVCVRRLVCVLQGQVRALEGRLTEQRVQRVEELVERCRLETQQELEEQQRRHSGERADAERITQHTPPQAALQLRSLLQALQQRERVCLQERLRAGLERAQAQAHRQVALRRRSELHHIFSEELQEAVCAGELHTHMADALLLQYYSSQDTLEEVLDVLVANQRALLAERHAHRRFLLQSLQSLQSATRHAFNSSAARLRDWSTHTHRPVSAVSVCAQGPELQLEILQLRQTLDESVRRERRAVRGDIIKRRRQMLTEKVCEHRRQLQDVCVCPAGPVRALLHRGSELLLKQSLELAELLRQLDEETVARARKVSLCVLQGCVVQLKARAQALCPAAVCVLPQTEAVQECVRCVCAAAARALRSDQRRVRRQQQQELQEQRSLREQLREFSSCLCACQPPLSREQHLRLQLECVKAACRLDRCLLLHQFKQHCTDSSDPATTPSDPTMPLSDPATTPSDPTTTPSDPTAIFNSVSLSDPTVTPCDPTMTLSDPSVTPSDPTVTLSDPTMTLGDPAAAQRSSEVTELQCFRRCIEERLRRQDGNTPDDTPQQEACVLQEQQLRVCQERLAVFAASLQCERVEKKVKVTETHTALLKLQTLIAAELHNADATHTIHTHRQALEEAELRLQQEEGLWAESAGGRGSSDEEEEGVCVEGGVSALLQEALFSTQQLTHRALRRIQTLEYQKEQLQVNRLQMYCDQELVFTAALVKRAQISAPDLHEALRLLLPTVPEGELLSLMDALGPGAGDGSGRRSSFLDRLRLEVLHRRPDPERHRDRWRKKRQKLLDKFLSSGGGSEDIRETQIRGLPERDPPTNQQREAGLVMRAENEGAGATAQDSLVSVADDNEGVWPVGGAQDSPASSERLFVFRCPPPTQQQLTLTPHRRKKKRSFLNFKKASVAPQPHT